MSSVDSMMFGLRYVGGLWFGFGVRLYGSKRKASKTSKGVKRDIVWSSKIGYKKLAVVGGEGNVFTDMLQTEFLHIGIVPPKNESMEVQFRVPNPLERKDAEDSPKNVNNDSVSHSSRVLREEDVRGVKSDLVDSFEEGEIRDDSVSCKMNGLVIKDCIEQNLEDDADNEDVTPVIAPEKTPSLPFHLTPGDRSDLELLWQTFKEAIRLHNALRDKHRMPDRSFFGMMPSGYRVFVHGSKFSAPWWDLSYSNSLVCFASSFR
ncbi:hypothetical protein Tco_0599590 [Tanacetum coccineum]